jgi:hypothetical protein
MNQNNLTASTPEQTSAIKPLLTKSLPPQELDKHRADVCLVLEIMVRKHDKFGWDQMNAGMRQMIREDWLLALSPYPVDECRAACRIHTQDQPNKVPNEGHIKAIILRERAKAVAAQPKPVEVTPERGAVSAEMKARADAKVAQFLKGAAI